MSRTSLLFSFNLSSHWHLLTGALSLPFFPQTGSMCQDKLLKSNFALFSHVLHCHYCLGHIIHSLLSQTDTTSVSGICSTVLLNRVSTIVSLTPARMYKSEGSYTWNLSILSKIRNIPSLSHKVTFLFIYLTVYIASYFQQIVLLVLYVN